MSAAGLVALVVLVLLAIVIWRYERRITREPRTAADAVDAPAVAMVT